jgi:hypothetical protein
LVLSYLDNDGVAGEVVQEVQFESDDPASSLRNLADYLVSPRS